MMIVLTAVKMSVDLLSGSIAFLADAVKPERFRNA